MDLELEKTLAGMSIFSFFGEQLELMPGSKITVEYKKTVGEEEQIYTSSAFIGESASGTTSGIVEKKRLGEDYYKVWLKKCMCCENPNDAKVLLSVLTLDRENEEEQNKIKMLEEETTLLRNIVYNNPMLYDLITRKPTKPSDGAGEPLGVNTGTEVFRLRRNQYQTREVIHGIKSIDGSPPSIVLGLVGKVDQADNENEVKYMEDMLLFSNYVLAFQLTSNIEGANDEARKDLQDILDISADNSTEMHSVFFKAIKIDKEKFKIFIIDFRRQEEIPNNKYRIRWWAIPSKAFPS